MAKTNKTKAPMPAPQPAASAAGTGGGATGAGPGVKMTEEQVAESLTALPEWSDSGGAIQRTYAFKTFIEAMAFVNKVAAAAEAADHHPDILIRYNKVTTTLSTHDASGITSKDFDLAARLDGL